MSNMLRKTLQQMIDQNLTTAKEMGELAGVSTSTVYRWISGESQPDFDAVRLLIRLLPNRRAQELLISLFIAGTPWRSTYEDLELDVNDDGRVDADDVLDASIEAVRTAAQALAAMRKTSRKQGYSADDTIALIAQLSHIVQQCTISQRVLVELAEQRRRRKLKLAK